MVARSDGEVARRSNLIAAMPSDVAQAILSQSVIRTYDRGETIFLQGERSETFFIVIEGWIKLYRIAQNGAEAVVACFSEGQSFGEAVALQRAAFPVTAEAVTDCRLMHVRATVLFEMIQNRPELVVSIMATLYQHFQALVAQIEQLKAQTGSQRVAEFLLELCNCETGSCTVRLPYDKILIAGRLGMKPESLSRAFSRLRKVGVVVNHSNAAIADVERLRAFAAQDPAEAWSRVQ
ncbi:MAG: Crp/Fnr family transcriptional regulator [Rhodobacteraceae bacterium]|nr:Crp/Fnr family transcriptional regulator [Paracoccaceae bacterium]MCC0066019.1 Crp/Fnr family transcriptional regulator [Rhodovulum sp.]